MRKTFRVVLGLGLGLGAIILASCTPTLTQVDSPQISNLRLQEYFPLHVGASWKYKIYSYIDRRHKIFVRRIVEKKGKKYIDNANAVYSYDTHGLREGLRYLLKYPLKVGNKWLSVVGVTAIERYLIASVGRTVRVPAGTFQDCIVVRSRQRVDSQRTLEAHFYFAPKVGFVKITMVLDNRGHRKPQWTYELLSHNLEKTSKIPSRPTPSK